MSTQPHTPSARASDQTNVTALRSVQPDASAAPDPQPERHDGWTPDKQGEFLRRLASTHCVASSARSVGMSRQSAYRLRARLKGEPFDCAWTAAFRRKYDALSEAALERALHGTEVPHFYKGELVHTSRRYDERLTVALLAMRARLDLDAPALFMEQAAYPDGDLDALIERVETGDEQWLSDEDYEEAETEDDEAEAGA